MKSSFLNQHYSPFYPPLFLCVLLAAEAHLEAMITAHDFHWVRPMPKEPFVRPLHGDVSFYCGVDPAPGNTIFPPNVTWVKDGKEVGHTAKMRSWVGEDCPLWDSLLSYLFF